MATLLNEKNGDRKFERLSRWNTLDYTLISRNNQFAAYADNYNSSDAKLNLTCFHVGTTLYPLRRFGKLDKPVSLDELSTISRYDPVTGFYLEINSDKSKVRLYREVAADV